MNNSSKRASTALFAFMIIVLVAGAIVPIFTRGMNSANQSVQPTTVPTATFPAPPATSSVTFDTLYFQPSGIFAVAQPEGWEPSAPVNEAGRAAITMTNNTALSVLEATVEQPAVPVADVEALDARFDETYLSTSWSRYGAWDETARRTEDDRLILDFNLTLNRQQYIARQISWTDGEWIYSTRAVAPANANQLVVHLVNGMADSLIPFKQFAGTPFNWTAHYDDVANHIIRFPSTWSVVDNVAGGPTSIVGPNGEALRLEQVSGATIASAEDAEAWVMQRQPNATILTTAEVTRGEASGYSVAYSFSTVDGDAQSGLAVLLTDSDGTVHAANLRFAAADVDLNTLDAPEADPEATAEPMVDTSADSTLALVMRTFSMLPVSLNLAGPQVTPTPLPTATTVEVAATEAAEMDATEAPAEAMADATEAAE